MASPCTILCADTAQWFALAEAEVRRIETKYSRFLADSVLSQINANSGDWHTLDEETAALFDFAASCYLASEGLFDISSGVLQQAWPFKATDPEARRPPEDKVLARLLPYVGFDKIKRRGPEIFLPLGMRLDFGGIAKEYAVDRVCMLLSDLGAKDFLVNLGGDIRVFNHHAPPWMVGIVHPRQEASTVASLPLTNAAIATSGDYERYFDFAGKRYCHLLDPRNGFPVQQAQSVSVIASSCMVAGSLSSMAMLSTDPEQFLLESGANSLLIDARGEAHRFDSNKKIV
ncbi:MAG: hypothetical protein RLZZ502_118 [Pseudomonadota bacterium]